MSRVTILIGGNLGEREHLQNAALECIGNEVGPILARSSLYESAPWGFDHERDFLNRVVSVDTALSPHGVLHVLLRIEDRFGRERQEMEGYQGRILDLDILYYEDRVLTTPDLKIPHPRIAERRFTLLPLNELDPDFIDPHHGCSIASLLEDCQDPLEVRVLHESSPA